MKTLPYLHGKSPIQFLIENRKEYDDALGINEGCGIQAAAEHEALRTRLSAAIKVLKHIEYIDVGDDWEHHQMCPRCGNATHLPNCELKAALQEQP